MLKQRTTQQPSPEQIRDARRLIEDFRAALSDVPRRANSSETEVGAGCRLSWTAEQCQAPRKLGRRSWPNGADSPNSPVLIDWTDRYLKGQLR